MLNWKVPVLLRKSGLGHKMHYSVSKIISVSMFFRSSMEGYLGFQRGPKQQLSLDTPLWNEDINHPVLLRSHPEGKPE